MVVDTKSHLPLLKLRLQRSLPIISQKTGILNWHHNGELDTPTVLTVSEGVANYTNHWLRKQAEVVFHDVRHRNKCHLEWAMKVMMGPEAPKRVLRGRGVTIAIMDTGIDLQNPLFKGRAVKKVIYTGKNGDSVGGFIKQARVDEVVVVKLQLSDETGLRVEETDFEDTHNGHGTHCSGALLDEGSKLVVVDLDLNDQPHLTLPTMLGPLLEALYKGGSRVFSNSWGAETNHYTFQSMEFDKFTWLHEDALVFISAGNSGPAAGTIGSPATAKNIIAIGASQNHHLSFFNADPLHFSNITANKNGFLWQGGEDNIAQFSSRGPTWDGRQKPDLVAPGEFILSGRALPMKGEKPFLYMRGTSMSCPLAAREGAYLQEYLIKKTGGPHQPSSALLKASLVAMATPLKGRNALMALSLKREGWVGMKRGKPLHFSDQGWGRVTLMEETLHLLTFKDRIPFTNKKKEEGEGGGGGNKEFYFTATHHGEISMAIVWTDPPVLPYKTAKVLVNDFNLWVQVGGRVFIGNNQWDELNNVEKVTFPVQERDKIKVSIWSATGGVILLPPKTVQFVSLAIFPSFLIPVEEKEKGGGGGSYPVPEGCLFPATREAGILINNREGEGGKECVQKCSSPIIEEGKKTEGGGGEERLYYINGKCQCAHLIPFGCPDQYPRFCLNGVYMPCQPPKSTTTTTTTTSLKKEGAAVAVRRSLRGARVSVSWYWIVMWGGVGTFVVYKLFKRFKNPRNGGG
jgi:hypothetical protein